MTAILNIYNNMYCKLEKWQENIEAHIVIDNATSCMKKGAQFAASYRNGMWDGKTRLNSKSKGFPLGLLSTVEKDLKKANIDYKIVDNRDRPLKYDLDETIELYNDESTITLRDYQYIAVKTALEKNVGIINVATNGGKCITKNTRILTTQGYKTLEDIFIENDTPCNSEEKVIEAKIPLINGYGEVEETSHITFNGMRKVRNMVTKSGLEQSCTLNHPLLVVTPQGEFTWKVTKDIKVGDLLVTRIGDNIYGNDKTISPEEAYSLGVIIADGCIEDSCKLTVMNDKNEILDYTEKYFNSLHGKRIYREKSRNSVTVTVSDKTCVSDWHNRIGIGFEVEKDKYVPKCIMGADRETQLAFICGYLESGCNIEISRPKIEVTSASKRLLSEIQLILKNMGILSSVSEKPSKRYPDSYYGRLTIDSKHAYMLLKIMNFKTAQRKEQAELGITEFMLKPSRPTSNSTPNGKKLMEYYCNYYNGKLLFKDKKKMQVSNNISRDRVRELLEEYPDGDYYAKCKLEKLIDTNLYFDEVISITENDEIPTFDVCMPNTHSFVAESIINHNTEIACGIIKSLLENLPNGKRVLFVTGSKEIFYQSKERIEKRLGIDVGLWGDKKMDIDHTVVVGMIPTIARKLIVPKDLNATQRKRLIGLSESEKIAETRKIKKEMKQTANKVKEFMESVAILIGDEAHHSSSCTWYDVILSCVNSQYRIGLTGTVDKTDPLHFLRLTACTGDILVKINNDYLISEGHSAKPTVNLISYNYDSLGKMSYQTARNLGIINNPSRNQAYITMIRRCIEKNMKCLVVVNEVEHGELIQEMLSDMKSVVFVNGNSSTKFRTSVLEEMRKGNINVTIATSIFDEGVDISGINAIFLMAGGKSMRQLLQRIGRGLRKKADGSGVEVYDSMDLCQEYLTEHTLSRYNTYAEEGFDIRKVTV